MYLCTSFSEMPPKKGGKGGDKGGGKGDKGGSKGDKGGAKGGKGGAAADASKEKKGGTSTVKVRLELFK